MILCSKHARRAGFTLIEIMIVIAIIAILAGIMVPNFVQARAEAQLEACRRNIVSIMTAIHLAMTRDSFAELTKKANGTSASIDAGKMPLFLVEYGYLDKLPICPSGGAPVSYGYYGCGILTTRENCFCACMANIGGKYGHVVGNKRIRPYWMEGFPVMPSMQSQNGNWQDVIEEI